jgi:hypothetical protein
MKSRVNTYSSESMEAFQAFLVHTVFCREEIQLKAQRVQFWMKMMVEALTTFCL